MTEDQIRDVIATWRDRAEAWNHITEKEGLLDPPTLLDCAEDLEALLAERPPSTMPDRIGGHAPEIAALVAGVPQGSQDAIQGGNPTTAPLFAERPQPPPTMADAAEMLWVVLANVSGGDWTKQSAEWQEAAARWRDCYYIALKHEAAERPQPPDRPLLTLAGVLDSVASHLDANKVHQPQHVIRVAVDTMRSTASALTRLASRAERPQPQEAQDDAI